jgi:acetyltransferase-like isoleucine patch superfamily enzyme
MRNTALQTRWLRVWLRDLLVNGLGASVLLPRGLRWRYLRMLGMDVSRSSINARCFFGGRDVTIGTGTFINYGAFIDNAAAVRIGAKVSVGPNVSIITGTHELGQHDRRAGEDVGYPVVVEDGAWIGGGSTILPGVTIGRGAMVAAGALVSRDVPANAQVAGVPAVVVKDLPALTGGEGSRTDPA